MLSGSTPRMLRGEDRQVRRATLKVTHREGPKGMHGEESKITMTILLSVQQLSILVKGILSYKERQGMSSSENLLCRVRGQVGRKENKVVHILFLMKVTRSQCTC